MKKDFTNDTLLARWLSGELSDAEDKELREHPDFAAYQQLMGEVDQLRPPAYETTAALKALKAKRGEKTASASGAKVVKMKQKSPYRWLAVAAVMLALVAFWFLRPGQALDFTAGNGEQLVAELPDGSSVKLNAGSELSFSEQGPNRLAELKGEGYFEVSKSETPFVVNTPLGQVKVLGTTFNVYSREERLHVSCASGKVAVIFANDPQEYILLPGQSVAQNAAGKAMVTAGQTDEDLDWLDGQSTFSGATLSEILDELSRQYDLTFDLPPGLDPDQRLTTVFPNNDLDQALDIVLPALQGVTYQRTGRKVLVKME